MLPEQFEPVDAIDVLHRDPQMTVVLTGVEDRHDGRMHHAGGEFGLPDEALPVHRIAAEFGGQHLEGLVAWQVRVAGQVDLAHAAATDEPDDGVAGKVLTRIARHPLSSALSQHATVPVCHPSVTGCEMTGDKWSTERCDSLGVWQPCSA